MINFLLSNLPSHMAFKRGTVMEDISENVSVAKMFASTGLLAMPVNSKLSAIPSGAAINMWIPSNRAEIASGKVCKNIDFEIP